MQQLTFLDDVNLHKKNSLNFIDPIFNIISDLRGADIWDPSVRYLSKLPARLELSDILLASSLSITLSFVVTFFPARRAAKLNPVEALRDE